jgi:uncharacterized protein YdeI (YjbR/CyaY-like superfamily)
MERPSSPGKQSMAKKDPQVDAYIAKSADFAVPVLNRIRKLVHAACPEVEETIKWSRPHFMYHGMMCGMAAFKQHCTFGFWHPLIRNSIEGRSNDDAMGQFGRITSVADLPKDAELKRLVKVAMNLNENGVKRPQKPKRKPPTVMAIPHELATAFKKNPAAKTAFDGFSTSHKNEYSEWITEAKRDETRAKRVATTIEWLSEGKKRNWKYENC